MTGAHHPQFQLQRAVRTGHHCATTALICIIHLKLYMSETFSKKEKEKKKQQKKKEKEQRKSDRKANAKSGQSLEEQMAYVDENGNISSKPPDLTKKVAINENDIVIGSRNIEGMD